MTHERESECNGTSLPSHAARRELDPDTRQLCKSYFKLLQAVHHKGIVDRAISTKIPPKGMARQTRKLAAFIKPASPTEELKRAVEENTSLWLENNLRILQHHYDTITENYRQLMFNEVAFQVATLWAERRYRGRLSPDTARIARGILQDLTASSGALRSLPPSPTMGPGLMTSVNPNLYNEEEFPVLPKPGGDLGPQQNRLTYGPSTAWGPRGRAAPDPRRSFPCTVQIPTTGRGRVLSHPIQPHVAPIGSTDKQDTVDTELIISSTSSTTQMLGGQVALDLQRSASCIGQLSGTTQQMTPSRPVQLQVAPLEDAKKQDEADVELITFSTPMERTAVVPRRSVPSDVQTPASTCWMTSSRPARPRGTLLEVTSIRGDADVELSTLSTPSTARVPVEQVALDIRRSVPCTVQAPVTVHLMTPPRFIQPQVAPLETGETVDLDPVHHTAHRSNVAIEISQSITMPLSNVSEPQFTYDPTAHTSLSSPQHDLQTRCCNNEGAAPPMVGLSPMEPGGNYMMNGHDGFFTTAEKAGPAHSEPNHITHPGCAASVMGPNTQTNGDSSTLVASCVAKYRPIQHRVRDSRKVQDWHFKCRKTIWFLGDSNLFRLPAFTNPDVQIDSYPGANFYHFQHVLDKTLEHPHVKIVVLSIGINNKSQDPHKTSIKQLRMIYRRALSVFPNASVFLPLINFSTSLMQQQQSNLTVINNFISNHFPYLNSLPPESFKTTKDNIHWTTETAESMMQSWCKDLKINLI